MNALPILLIGIPLGAVKYAEYRWNRQRIEDRPAPMERVDCWSGFTAARRDHPPLSEMGTR